MGGGKGKGKGGGGGEWVSRIQNVPKPEVVRRSHNLYSAALQVMEEVTGILNK
jgi:hypothetical protein